MTTPKTTNMFDDPEQAQPQGREPGDDQDEIEVPQEEPQKTTAGQMLARVSERKEKMDRLGALLNKAKDSFSVVATKHLTPERLIKLAMVAASRQPLLLECTASSILQSVMTSAQLGLDCSGGVQGEAYLVPYRNAKSGQREAQLIVGYRGLLSLARRSGELDTLEAHPVHEKDTFECAFGLEPILTHRPNLTAEDPGKLVIVYAIARLKDGGRQVEVMTKYQVDGIRKRSKAANAGPWVTDYEEMARKTVVRRICKYLPMSLELAAALDHEDRVEGAMGGPGLEIVNDAPEEEDEALAAAVAATGPEPPQEPPKSHVEKLKAKVGKKAGR